MQSQVHRLEPLPEVRLGAAKLLNFSYASKVEIQPGQFATSAVNAAKVR
jgi:hypothetical protein